MARIARSQPNEAMARIVPKRNSAISLDPSLAFGSEFSSKALWTKLDFFYRGLKYIQKKDWARQFYKKGSSPPVSHHHHNHHKNP
jgi:hypothetical protein